MKYYILALALFTGITAHAQRTVIDLNGTWEFDRTEKAFPPATFTRSIPVPGLIHLAEPKIDDYDLWFKKAEAAEAKQQHGVYDIDYIPKYNWYRKQVDISDDLAGKEFLLRIKKSQYVSQVYVNGLDMGTSMECYTPIELPVTRAIKPGEENEILIKVGDRYWLPPQAAGSTDKEKEHYLPGIWDDVELIASGMIQVNNTLILPNAEQGSVNVKARLRSYYPQQIMYGDPKSDSIIMEVALYEKESGLLAGKAKVQVEARREHFTETALEVRIDHPKLWSPDEPFLYTAQTTIWMDEQIIDRQEDLFGLRDFERRGKYFYLNGEKSCSEGQTLLCSASLKIPIARPLPGTETGSRN